MLISNDRFMFIMNNRLIDGILLKINTRLIVILDDRVIVRIIFVFVFKFVFMLVFIRFKIKFINGTLLFKFLFYLSLLSIKSE